jgi:anti-sigma factor RsiW
MSCAETELLIHPYLDDELDPARSLEIEHHLEECPACARAWREQVRLRNALRSMAPYYRAPDSLRRRVERQSSRRAPRPAPWLAAAAAVALLAVVLWKVPGQAPEADVVSDHIRSLMANHLTDVPSGDGHTVKPWFNGKVDFSPQVRDLAEQGFRLIGGRLDYLRGRPVAAIVYQRRQHVINLFTWPAAGAADRAAKTDARQGYNVVSWLRGGMNYWVVSDLNPKELGEFVRLSGGG